MSARILGALTLLAGCATAPAAAPLADASAGQKAWAAACEDFDDWDKPGPPFRIYGNTYYVGTCGITALLIVDPDGHTVIDSGTDEGAKVVLAKLEAEDRASPVRGFEDLPLFAASPQGTPSSERDAALETIIAALAALHPDEMSPREALETLYALKARISEANS